ncbi:hypothetical protein P4O66_020641 [Electrophorus voltai]|uniref:Uncharacterized protein n=1 Tax=Electrophorus voltai TaxID=2609070 RepID=A0AAD8ZWE5_9TELE|nr:hypothetical protein P4O66_020641 [Electrophorus voltai]
MKRQCRRVRSREQDAGRKRGVLLNVLGQVNLSFRAPMPQAGVSELLPMLTTSHLRDPTRQACVVLSQVSAAMAVPEWSPCNRAVTGRDGENTRAMTLKPPVVLNDLHTHSHASGVSI